MVLVFWVSVAAVLYVYAGYPAMLRVWARLRPRPVLLGAELGSGPDRRAAATGSTARHAPSPVDFTPLISIVIAARNEGARLAARLDNLLMLDYPAARRQIVVVSDGSTDGTLDVLTRYGHFVDVVALPAGGKAVALNAGLERATGEIVVFADARQMFAADALRELVAPFRDATVGAVTGELLLDAESPCRRIGQERRAVQRRADQRGSDSDRRVEERRQTVRSTIADGVGLYWKYEKQLRRLESRIGSTLSATGAIYAIRRALYRPLPADTILDDVLTPMRVVLAGYRVVFNDRARAFDRAAVDADAEARRKVRTLAGNYQILALEPRLLLPWRNPVWLQYLSHKLGRLAVPYALLAIFSASIVLSGTQFFSLYGIALTCQVLFYLLAGVGAVLEFLARHRVSAAVDPAAAPVATTPSRLPAREIA